MGVEKCSFNCARDSGKVVRKGGSAMAGVNTTINMSANAQVVKATIGRRQVPAIFPIQESKTVRRAASANFETQCPHRSQRCVFRDAMMLMLMILVDDLRP